MDICAWNGRLLLHHADVIAEFLPQTLQDRRRALLPLGKRFIRDGLLAVVRRGLFLRPAPDVRLGPPDPQVDRRRYKRSEYRETCFSRPASLPSELTSEPTARDERSMMSSLTPNGRGDQARSGLQRGPRACPTARRG